MENMHIDIRVYLGLKPYNIIMYIYNAGHSLEINPSQVNSQASIFTTATPGTS